MTEKPLVSIIVPIYNAQDHIARCVESIRRQTYQNLEILLLNDGSKDVSLEVCRMYAKVDPRIVLIDKANSGVAATRNMGLREAKGKYLQFVDADDTIQPYATELLVRHAEESGADLVIAHYNRISPPKPRAEGSQRPERPTRVQTFGFLMEGPMTKEEFAAGLMQEPASFYYGVLWNKLYRTALIRDNGVLCREELNWSEDFLFNLEYIRYAHRFCAVDTPVYYYVKNEKSITHTQIDLVGVVKTKAKLFTYYKGLYESLGLYEKFKPQIYKYLVATAEHP